MKKVYILFYSMLFDNDEDIYGIYSTYENAENAIPNHEVDEFFEIFEASLDKTFIWDKPDKQ